MRRLAVAADDVCTTADRAYRYVPGGGFVPAITAGNSKLSYSRFRISTRQSTSSAAAELTTSLYMEVVALVERACRVWPLSHVGSEGHSSGR